MSWEDEQEISVQSHHSKFLVEVEVAEEVDFQIGLIREGLEDFVQFQDSDQFEDLT